MFLLVVLVYILEVALEVGDQNHAQAAAWHQKQESRLGLAAQNHYQEGHDYADPVENHAPVEVGRSDFRNFFCCFILGGFLQNSVYIIPNAKRDKNAWDYDVPKAQNREFYWGCCQVYRKHQLDWSIYRFCHSYHNIRTINPENIVEKESPEQDKRNLKIGEIQALNPVDREQNPIEIVQQPVSCEHVVHRNW